MIEAIDTLNKNTFSNAVYKTLLEYKEGLTITELTQLSNIPRSAVRIHLARLEGANAVTLRKIGMAKVYIINQDILEETHKTSLNTTDTQPITNINQNINKQNIKEQLKFLSIIILCLTLCPIIINAQTIEVTTPTYITSNNDYDISPTIINDGTDYWIFYTKADTTPAIRGEIYYEETEYAPLEDSYSIYYKRISALDELSEAPEISLELSLTNRPTGFYQQRITAEYFNNKIYVFASSERTTSDDSLYYYTYDLDTEEWQGPQALIYGMIQNFSNVNYSDVTRRSAYRIKSAVDEDNIYLTANGRNLSYMIVWDGLSYANEYYIINETIEDNETTEINESQILMFYNSYNLTIYNLSTCETNDTPNELAITINSQEIYLSGYVYEVTPKIYAFKFNREYECLEQEVVISEHAEYAYPAIFYDEDLMYSISSYLNSGIYSLVMSYSNNFTGPWTQKTITTARYDLDEDGSYLINEKWFDISSEPFYDVDSGKKYLFYATESEDHYRQDSEIVYYEINWNISNDHQDTIQNAILEFSDIESENPENPDIIENSVHVLEGIYIEKLIINNSLNLIGENVILTSPDNDIYYAGITLKPSSTNTIFVSGFTFTNFLYGIFVPTGYYAENIILINNSITGNLDSGILNENSEYLDATLNYWGDDAGPGGVLHGAGDEFLGNILYSPWLTNGTYDNTQYLEVLDADDYVDQYFSNIGVINYYSEDLPLFKDINGVLINWLSNDTSAISDDGIITISENEKTVILTAILSFKDSTHLNRNITLSLEADNRTAEEIVTYAYDFLTLEGLNINEVIGIGAHDLYLPTRWNDRTGLLWTSSNSEIIDIGHSYGYLYTPEINTTIILTARLSKDNFSLEKNFSILVVGDNNSEIQLLNPMKRVLDLEKMLDGNTHSIAISTMFISENISDYDASFDNELVWESTDNSILSSSTQNNELFIFTESNIFTDLISTGTYIYRDYEDLSQWSDYGALIGNNIEFSCNPCQNATFEDSITDLNEYSGFCGFDSTIVTSIIRENITLCIRNSDNNMRYNLDILSYTEENDCIDDDDGACAAVDYRTSYLKKGFMDAGEISRTYNDTNSVYLTATIIGDTQNITKDFLINIPISVAPSSYNSGIATFYPDTEEIVFNAANINFIREVLIPEYVAADEDIFLNFYDLYSETETVNISVGLSIYRDSVSVIISNDTMIFGSDWNGIFMVPKEESTYEYMLSSDEDYDIIKVITLGGFRNITFSKAVKIIFSDMDGYVAAYSDGSYDPLLQILSVCVNETPNPDGACYYYDSEDLVIATYHLSSFAVLEENSRHSRTQNTENIDSVSLFDPCTEDWTCGLWSECIDGYSERICNDNNYCGTDENTPEMIVGCDVKESEKVDTKDILNDKDALKDSKDKPKALFDIILEVLQEPDESNNLILRLTLINFGRSGLIDANLTYTITDSDGLIVFQEKKVEVVDTQKQFIKDLNVSYLANGKYSLNVNLEYDGQEYPASAEKFFNVGFNNDNLYIIGAIVILSIGGLFFIWRKVLLEKHAKAFAALAVDELNTRNAKKDVKTSENVSTQKLFEEENKLREEIILEQDKNSSLGSVNAELVDKLLVNSPDDKAFFFDNRSVKNIASLVSELQVINDDTFRMYVNDKKNDFASWIRNVFSRKDIAEKISGLKSRQDMINTLRIYC